MDSRPEPEAPACVPGADRRQRPRTGQHLSFPGEIGSVCPQKRFPRGRHPTLVPTASLRGHGFHLEVRQHTAKEVAFRKEPHKMPAAHFPFLQAGSIPASLLEAPRSAWFTLPAQLSLFCFLRPTCRSWPHVRLSTCRQAAVCQGKFSAGPSVHSSACRCDLCLLSDKSGVFVPSCLKEMSLSRPV